MAKKKKLLTAVAAVATAAAVMLGGTFAWQSISQTALNEASDVINPGGRLHDDFYIDDNGDYNADIYVENFAEDPIIARVKLSEYMEVVINQGVDGAEIVDTIVGSKSLEGEEVTDKATDNTSGYTYEYVTHYFDQENVTDSYWNWTMGSADSEEVWYMPTFNMNKDSLVADRNGMYVDRIGGISNRSQGQYEDWTVWTDGNEKTGDEIWDVDSNQVDEVGYDFENLQTYVDAENIALSNETHEAKPVGSTSGLISMQEWIDNGAQPGDYWVYDTDGWVYWAQLIPGGETTGLLLDAIELDNVMDDTWYYAIEATGQFVTPDDIGKDDNTGFYADGQAPSAEAETLLEAIGATVPEENENPSTHYLELNYDENAEVSGVKVGDAIILSVNEDDIAEYGESDLSSVTVTDNDTEEELEEGVDYTYDSSTNTLVILNENVTSVHINDNSSNDYGGDVILGESGSDDDWEDDEPIYSAIGLNHDGRSDTMRGGEWLLFTATVYDDAANEIASTKDVTFTVQESLPSDAVAAGLFDTTYMDENALFVAEDVVTRGVTQIIVTAKYTDENNTEYQGTYELDVQPGESPLKIGLQTNGVENTMLPGDNVFQMFPANPSANTYQFSTKYNEAAVTGTWSLVPMEGWYTVGTENGICYAYAVVDPEDSLYDWTPEGETPVANGDKVAQIDTATGEFKVLLGETFPRTMQFEIKAEYTADGESYQNTVYLFLGRVGANFVMYNNEKDSSSVDSHNAQYTKGEESVITLGFKLSSGGGEQEINVTKLQNWALYEYEYADPDYLIDESEYTIEVDANTKTATLTIPANSGIEADELTLAVEYKHGIYGPREPEGISDASVSIIESSVSADDNEVSKLQITDEYGETETTYTKGEYQKIKLEAYAYTNSGDEVYSGTVIWAIEGNPENVRLVQNGFTAEVQLMKANVESIKVIAQYSKPGESSIHTDATFIITAESNE